jgi:glyoxylase I family protein
MKIEHVAFNVKEPVSMAKWYVENLGMKVIRAVEKSPYTRFMADESGQSVIEIYNNPAANVPDYASIKPLVLHIAFSVDDIEATRKRLMAAGATSEGEISTTEAGDKLAFLRDPWNVSIQLVKRRKPLT